MIRDGLHAQLLWDIYWLASINNNKSQLQASIRNEEYEVTEAGSNDVNIKTVSTNHNQTQKKKAQILALCGFT